MRIRCIRAGEARRRTGTPLSLSPEARIPSESGPFSLSVQERTHAVIALRHRQRCLTFNNLQQARPGPGRGPTCIFADVAQLEARDHATVEATGSSPVIRSISGVPVRHRLHAALGRARRDVHGVAPRVQRATRAGPEPATSRIDTAEMDSFFAPVMELAYMPALEAGFWEFESPLGHQHIRPRSSVGRAAAL